MSHYQVEYVVDDQEAVARAIVNVNVIDWADQDNSDFGWVIDDR